MNEELGEKSQIFHESTEKVITFLCEYINIRFQ